MAGGGRGVRAPQFIAEAHVFGVADCGRAPQFGAVSMPGSATLLGDVPR